MIELAEKDSITVVILMFKCLKENINCEERREKYKKKTKETLEIKNICENKK